MAADHYDLLTTVAHELGHILGKADEKALGSNVSTMVETLVRGEHRANLNGIDKFFQDSVRAHLCSCERDNVRRNDFVKRCELNG